MICQSIIEYKKQIENEQEQYRQQRINKYDQRVASNYEQVNKMFIKQ